MASTSLGDISEEQEPKVSMNKSDSSTSPNQRKHLSDGTYHAHHSKTASIEAQAVTVSQLDEKNEDQVSTDAPSLSKSKVSNVAPSRSIRSTSYPGLPKTNEQDGTTTPDSPEPSLTSLSELTFSTFTVYRTGFEKSLLEDNEKLNTQRVLKTKQSPRQPNHDSQPSNPLMTKSSSKNINSTVSSHSGKPTVSVVVEDGSRIPPLPENNNQSTYTNSEYLPMFPLGVSGTRPISRARKLDWLRRSFLYECRYCRIIYKDDLVYCIHMHAHSRRDPYTCVCGEAYPKGRFDFNVHLFTQEHEPPGPFHHSRYPLPTTASTISDLPDTSFRFPRTISNDRKDYWRVCKTLYECLKCRTLYREYSIYALHAQAHSSVTSPFRCICGFNGMCSYLFNVHLYIHAHHRPSDKPPFVSQ